MAEITQADYDLVGGWRHRRWVVRGDDPPRFRFGAIRILEAGHSVAFPELAGPAELDIGYGEPVEAIEVDGNGLVVKSKYKCAVMCSQRFRG